MRVALRTQFSMSVVASSYASSICTKSHLQCSILLDRSGPKIAEAVCLGKVFPKVEIHCKSSAVNSGRETFYKYELKNVMVCSYSVSGGSQDKPHESFSLNFEEIKVTYTEMNEKGEKKGDVAYGWKVEEGVKA